MVKVLEVCAPQLVNEKFIVTVKDKSLVILQCYFFGTWIPFGTAGGSNYRNSGLICLTRVE